MKRRSLRPNGARSPRQTIANRDDDGSPTLESEKEFIQLSDACNFLEHYHTAHTADKITRFRSKSRTSGADIYVVGDLEWRQKLLELTDQEMVSPYGRWPICDNPSAPAPPALASVPSAFLIARTDAEIHRAGETFEPYRHATAEALRESGVLDSAIQEISQWALGKMQAGGGAEAQAAAGIGALTGALASGFQLGLLVAERMRNAARSEKVH